MSAHHFVFSRNWTDGRRLCGECHLDYDAGDHIEIADLKPYTAYVCPTAVRGLLGHSSIWTGAYRPELRSLRDKFCTCGAEYVEEDDERWRLRWEMADPWNGHWKPVERVGTKHGTHTQHDGLLQLIDQGEPIRNVSLERAT